MKTEAEIENLLRQAPKPVPTPQLAGELKRTIQLPQRPNGTGIGLDLSVWRRWLPAIGYAVLILGCVVVLAVQSQQQSAAVQELDQLRADIASKEQQVARQREQTRLALVTDARIKSLQDDATEADQLAVTLAELQALIAKLTADAAGLEAKLAEVPENNQVIAPYDFFHPTDGPMAEAKEKAAAISCINNMKQIGLAIRIWANDNNDQFPPNLNSVSNELGIVKTLCCPSDTATQEFAKQLVALPDGGWSRWPLNGGSYDVFLSPEVNDTKPNVIITRCRFHGHEGLADGSVHWGKKNGAPQP